MKRFFYLRRLAACKLSYIPAVAYLNEELNSFFFLSFSDARNNFLKYSRSVIDSLGTPYDYRSVMHYGRKYFSKNGKDTITPLKPGGVRDCGD